MTLHRLLATRATILSLAILAFCRSLFQKRSASQELSSFEHPGWRSRLALATLIFSAFWTARASDPQQPEKPAKPKDDKRPPHVTCYKVAAPIPPWNRTLTPTFRETLRAAWLALDKEQGEAFRQKVEEGIQGGQFTRSIGEFLSLAYQEIATHKARTSPEGARITCYKMTPLGSALMQIRDSATKQVDLLRKASKEGKLDEATIQKVKRTLARDLDLLKEAKERSASGQSHEGKDLILGLQTGFPTSQALDAAAIIVEMEKGS